MPLQPFLTAAVVFLVACIGSSALCDDPADTQRTTTVSDSGAKLRFSDDVLPLFAKYCANCHRGEKSPGDVVLQFEDEAEAPDARRTMVISGVKSSTNWPARKCHRQRRSCFRPTPSGAC